MHRFRSRPNDDARALRHEQGDERGGVIVEFAAVAMILVILIFGIVEGGLLFRAKLALANSTDEAVRQASIVGNRPTADYEILQQVLTHSTANASSIDQVVVFRAASPTDRPTESCREGISTTNECNVYIAEDFNRPPSDFGTCGALDGNWCPTSRDTTTGGDMVGVLIGGTYTPIAAVFGGVGLDTEAVLPFESKGSAR